MEIPSAKLLDEEAWVAAEHRALISRVALEIEAILLREGLTMDDFGQIVQVFNSRAHSVFARMSIKQITESYGKH